MMQKRKKNSRLRGSKTHGWGSMKKHRGAGSRGGVGNAGSGKRGDAKKPTYLKNKRRFGKHGFKNPNARMISATNISYLEKKLKTLMSKNLCKEENGVMVIDLKKAGFDKLLGTGTISTKFKIIANYASASAIEKVQKAGGEVILPNSAAQEPVAQADAE